MVLSGDSASPSRGHQTAATQSTLLLKEKKTGNFFSHDWSPSGNVFSEFDLIYNWTVALFAPGHNSTQMSAARTYAPAPCSIDFVVCTVCHWFTHNVIWINYLHLDEITDFSYVFISLVGYILRFFFCSFLQICSLHCLYLTVIPMSIWSLIPAADLGMLWCFVYLPNKNIVKNQ